MGRRGTNSIQTKTKQAKTLFHSGQVSALQNLPLPLKQSAILLSILIPLPSKVEKAKNQPLGKFYPVPKWAQLVGKDIRKGKSVNHILVVGKKKTEKKPHWPNIIGL